MQFFEAILTPSQKVVQVKVGVFESILHPSHKILGRLRWTFLNPYLVLPKKILGQSRRNFLFLYIHTLPKVYLALFQGLVALLQGFFSWPSWVWWPSLPSRGNSCGAKKIWRPRWRKQETQFTVSHLQNIRAIRAQSERNGKIQFTSFPLKTLEAQSEGTRKFHSWFFTSKFWRTKVKGTGIHEFSPQIFGGPKMKWTGNSILSFWPEKFGSPKWRKLEIQFTSSSHLRFLQAQSVGNRKLNSIVFASNFFKSKVKTNKLN